MSKIKVKPILICLRRGAQVSVFTNIWGFLEWEGGGEYFVLCKIK